MSKEQNSGNQIAAALLTLAATIKEENWCKVELSQGKTLSLDDVERIRDAAHQDVRGNFGYFLDNMLRRGL